MQRQRELEIICSNSILLLVSEQYAPGTRDRIVQFLADKGAVSGIIQYYYEDPSLERTCLAYWDAKLEPDALRLEDLVSAILIAFATSFAASLLIKAGEVGFPALYKRIWKQESAYETLRSLSALENQRREHLQVLLNLLEKKSEAIKSAEDDMNKEIAAIRSHLLQGYTLDNIDKMFSSPLLTVDIKPIETVVRGKLLTEEQRDGGFDTSNISTGTTQVNGVEFSKYLGVGQILHSKVSVLAEFPTIPYVYDDIGAFTKELQAPLRDQHKNYRLSREIRRSPKKIIAVGDKDLVRLLEQSPNFDEVRNLIGAIVVRSGGASSHTAVLSRNLGIACILLEGENFLRLKDFEFAAIQGGKCLLYQALPQEFYGYV